MKSAGKARNNGLYRHIRTSKEIIRNLLNDLIKYFVFLQRSFHYIFFSATDIGNFASSRIISVPQEIAGSACKVNTRKNFSEIVIVDDFSNSFIVQHFPSEVI